MMGNLNFATYRSDIRCYLVDKRERENEGKHVFIAYVFFHEHYSRYFRHQTPLSHCLRFELNFIHKRVIVVVYCKSPRNFSFKIYI